MVALVLSSGRARVSHGTQQRVVVLHACRAAATARQGRVRALLRAWSLLCACFLPSGCSYVHGCCFRVVATRVVASGALLCAQLLLSGRFCICACCFWVAAARAVAFELLTRVLVAFRLFFHLQLLLYVCLLLSGCYVRACCLLVVASCVLVAFDFLGGSRLPSALPPPLTALLRLKLPCPLQPPALPHFLPHSPLGHSAQPHACPALQEVGLDQDRHHPADHGGLHLGTHAGDPPLKPASTLLPCPP